MSTSCLVLTGLLLFFVQPVSGQNCTHIFSFCKTHLMLAPEFQVTDAPRSDCQTIEDHDKECNSYRNFWACMKSSMSACGMESQTDTKIKRFQEKYSSRCYQETLCQLKVGKCNCLKLATYNTSESTTDACKHLDFYEDCVSKITDCDHSTSVHNATANIKSIKSFCDPECPDSLTCWTQFVQDIESSSGSSNISIDNKQACRIFKAHFQCLTKTCSATLSDKWLRVGKSYEAACDVYEDWTNSTSCSSLTNCLQTFEVMSGITLQDTSTDETIVLANTEKVIAALTNPGWWCRYLISAQRCFERDANFCSLNSTQRKQAAALTATLDELCEASGEKCTAFLHSCAASLEFNKENGSIPLNPATKWCNDHSIDNICNSYTNFSLCVNTTMGDCLDDKEINAQLSVYQRVFQFYCTKELVCATRIKNCLCEAELVSDFTNITKMCNNQQNFTHCVEEIRDCDNVEAIKQATLYSTMMKVACSATPFLSSCPQSYKCFLRIQEQSWSGFGSSLNPGVKQSICMTISQSVMCMEQLKSFCTTPPGIDVESLKTSVGNACKGTDTSNGSPPPIRGTDASNGSTPPISGEHLNTTFCAIRLDAFRCSCIRGKRNAQKWIRATVLFRCREFTDGNICCC